MSKIKRVEVITGTDQQVLIDIYDPLMTGNVGSDLKIMQCFFDHVVSYTFKVTSANSISMFIWESYLKENLIADLQQSFERVTTEPVAMVCLLGTVDQSGLLAKATTALGKADINIISAGVAKGKVNIQFLIDREQFKSAIAALNQAVG